jgi:CheY-like chemotaxis protein
LPHKIRIALVKDNLSDARLFREVCVNHARAEVVELVDGEQALEYFSRKGRFKPRCTSEPYRPRSHLPKVSGHDILKFVNADSDLKSIPGIVFSTSGAAADMPKSYDLNASYYLRKPADLEGYEGMCSRLRRFWLDVALLPDTN